MSDPKFKKGELVVAGSTIKMIGMVKDIRPSKNPGVDWAYQLDSEKLIYPLPPGVRPAGGLVWWPESLVVKYIEWAMGDGYKPVTPAPEAVPDLKKGDTIYVPNPWYTGPKEAVNHPSHYGGDTTYEVIKVAEAWGLDKDAYLFTATKYIARAGKKDPLKELEDLKKARFYLDRKIKNMEARDGA